jgi:putative (di)nucleoside polyphosphate hydrolase
VSDAFFRAGVGAVVVDDAGKILVLKRVVQGAWQLPQGGMGADERPLDAVYRELHEETGLKQEHVELVSGIDDWLVYELPVEYRNAKVGLGQAQRWFLFRLLGSRDRVRPDQNEFDDAQWVSADELVARAVSFRASVYRKLVAGFAL